MASCKYKLPEEFLRKLSMLGSETDRITEEVLQAGGEVVLAKAKSNLTSVLSGNSSGELLSALGMSGILQDRNGNSNIKIGFSEPRKDGALNALIANVLEYGKHNQPPKPFMTPAKKQSKNECINTMINKLEEEIKKL